MTVFHSYCFGLKGRLEGTFFFDFLEQITCIRDCVFWLGMVKWVFQKVFLETKFHVDNFLKIKIILPSHFIRNRMMMKSLETRCLPPTLPSHFCRIGMLVFWDRVLQLLGPNIKSSHRLFHRCSFVLFDLTRHLEGWFSRTNHLHSWLCFLTWKDNFEF